MTSVADLAQRILPDPIADSLQLEAARLAAMPEFPQAVRAYMVGAAQFRESPRIVNKLVSYDTRWRVIGYLLYLALDRETYGPQGGATYGRVLDLCTRRNEVSPRVLKTVLALLQLSGFIEATRNATDRRSKFYRPTARMMTFVHRWLTYATTTLDVLEPHMQRAAMLRDDPQFAARFLVSGGRSHTSETPPADLMPEFIAFLGGRDGAGAVVLAMLTADLDSVATPSRADIARRFGLSKTQVSNSLREGERLGWVAFDRDGMPVPTQVLRDKYRQWIAIELAFYARHMAPA